MAIPARAGSAFVRLARQEVPVPDIEGIRRRQQAIELAKRPPQQRRAPRNPAEAVSYARHRIDRCLDAIRNSAFGARHPTYTAEAARAKAICDRYDLDWTAIKKELIAAYEAALTPEEARERRSSSTEGVLRWLDRRAAP